jgi:hypothetical protein
MSPADTHGRITDVANATHQRNSDMTGTTSRALRQSFIAIAATLLVAACGGDDEPDDPGGPGGPVDPPSPGYQIALETLAATDGRLPELGSCKDNLQLPEGSKVSFRVFGEGVQIYRWSGTSWEFVNPEADLYADAEERGEVGTHFGTPNGPAWLTASGSRVVGKVAENGRCTPDANAIPWLKLDAVGSGTGVFEQTTLIHRLNTVGGLAPSTPGAFVGDETQVPYTADYFFYRTP